MDLIQERITRGNLVFRELRLQGIRFEITKENKLRIETKTTVEQFEKICLWRIFIIERIAPNCSVCSLAMKLIDEGQLWFCPLVCEGRDAEQTRNINFRQHSHSKRKHI